VPSSSIGHKEIAGRAAGSPAAGSGPRSFFDPARASASIRTSLTIGSSSGSFAAALELVIQRKPGLGPCP
jgi:hypothetical protein